ncbi:MAG: hypothetical protein CTY39_02630 [Hyphomicrobium sp.]|nr:MAG: hypothetical protein CTY39_02630 [Hyphomicrobium sp.]
MKTFAQKIIGAVRPSRNIVGEVEALRTRRMTLADSRIAIEAAKCPRAEIDAALARDFDALAADAVAALEVGYLARNENGPRFSPQLKPKELLGLLVLTCREPIAKAIAVELDKLYEGGSGLSAVEKAEKLSAIDQEILDVELAEESAVRDAERQGHAIQRLGEADPRAVLAHDSALPRLFEGTSR